MNKLDLEDNYLKNIPILLVSSGEQFKIINKEKNIYFQKENNSKPQKILRMFGFKIPKYSHLELDEYSSFVFKSIDGKKNIYKIGELLKEKYGDDAEPIYDRLVLFLEHLKNEKKWIKYK